MTDSFPFLPSSVLCCFAFSLSQDWELPMKREVGGGGWSLAQQPAFLLKVRWVCWLRQGPCLLGLPRCAQPVKLGLSLCRRRRSP